MQSSPQSLYQLIYAQSKIAPDSPAILSPDKAPLTYRRLVGHLEATTLQLNRLGFRRGDRVAVVLPNGPEMAAAYLAVSSVCTCAPLNPAYPLDEFKFSMTDLHVKALLTSFGNDHPACQAAFGLNIPVVFLDPDMRIAGLFKLSSNLPLDGDSSRAVLAGLEDFALVLHTSGTTARPKIVPLTHRNIFYSMHNISAAYSLTPTDRCLNIMPLFHIHGLIGALSASLMAGAGIICAPGFTPAQVLGWLSDQAPTWYTAVPTIHQAILEQVRCQPEKVREVHLRFIRSCSSALAPQVGQDLETAFHAPVLEAYGMTEATHQMASNPLPPALRKFGSVGLPTGITKIAILDEKGQELPGETVGEICIRGENVMQGYENNPAANAAAFTGGWLRTGDRGLFDKDGYLFIQGRLKEIINRGGEKISPREIDEALLAHPDVKQAVAFAIPHPTLGEDVAAAVVLRAGAKVSALELRQFVASSLASFKVPRRIVFLEEIPKGATGKIQRIGLAEKLKAELDAVKTRVQNGQSVPRTPLEANLLSIWQQVLDQQSIGTQDDFLALGGDSIQAARILMLIDEHFKVNLSLGDLFNAPTIASMADLIQETQHKDF